MQVSKARILAALQPVISVLSGAFAAWLLVHLKVLDIFNAKSQVATLIASGIVFAVTAGLTWLSHHQHLIPITTAARLGVLPPKGKITLVEILAFLMPYISVVAGALSAWLFVHIHFLGIFHVAQKGVTQAIASGLVLAVTAGLTWAAAHFHFLPLMAAPSPAPVVAAHERKKAVR